ncbi:hypothetical protein BHE90_000969 [Fusarium euwallaceae]|uniref:Heterokaryon incompatibility domain-containing protein n=1 Tax=Fusarium euwallaceae TaxID=1147111 RepID=A0A430M8X9_9HYPO|nr:hypothetical protein BHE90_000969 [Fusarium euwallaceae]
MGLQEALRQYQAGDHLYNLPESYCDLCRHFKDYYGCTVHYCRKYRYHLDYAARCQAAMRVAEERRLAEEQRVAEERRLAEEWRLAEERRLAEEWRLAEQRRLAEEWRLAEERRLIAERKAAEEKRIAEEKRLAEEKRIAEEKRLAEEKKQAEQKRQQEEARRAEEKVQAEIRQAQENERRKQQQEEEDQIDLPFRFGVGNGDDITEMLDKPDGWCPDRMVFSSQDPLLDSTRTSNGCANHRVRPGLWPRFDHQWLAFKVDVQDNFLNALGAICKRSELQHCQNTKCVHVAQRVRLAAPQCTWTAFREWAVVAISCQYTMSPTKSENDNHDPPQVHIASAIGLMNTLLEKHYEDEDPIDGVLLGPGHRSTRLDISEITDVIYWMLTVQTQMDRNTVDYANWPQDYIPPRLLQPSIQRAESRAVELGLCLFRVHTLAFASSRKAAEIPAIVAGVNRRPELVHQNRGHERCTANRCNYMYRDNTGRTPFHNSPRRQSCGCALLSFSHSKLCAPIANGLPAVWSTRQIDTLVAADSEPYIAISHTWADGTGAHPEHPGSVNSCMFQFFGEIAAQLNCVGVWWDAISIPAKRNDAVLRAKAISKMHHNYQNASYTVVHDRYLRKFQWRDGDDACADDACLAVAFSPWFSRGWTSLELHISHNVVVLFGAADSRFDPSDSRSVVVKPLQDILSKHPALSPRAHRIAALLIEKVWRKRIENISEILAILHPRGTSWPSDVKLIQAHLAGCGDDEDLAMEEDETVFTRRVLGAVGAISRYALLHGFETLAPSGPFSWAPRSISDMPIASSDDFEGEVEGNLDIHTNGSVSGTWLWRYLKDSDTDTGALLLHKPQLLRDRMLTDKQMSYRLEQRLSTIPSYSVLETALQNGCHCALLYPDSGRSELRILVETLGVDDGDDGEKIIDCRYIAIVEELDAEIDFDECGYHKIRLGHPEAAEGGTDLRGLIQMNSDDESEVNADEKLGSEDEKSDDGSWDFQKEPGYGVEFDEFGPILPGMDRY